jgi:signal transduction histidine kinase/CheY-like chemotaxis protein
MVTLRHLPDKTGVAEQAWRDGSARERRGFRSLATKLSLFTASLVVWVTAVGLGFHYASGDRSIGQHLLVSVVLLAVAVMVARITSRVFVRPLVLLEAAMAAVKQGNLKPIRPSPTGDEIERLGKSFNEMISALAATKREVVEHRENLEEKIRERTEALEESTKRAERAVRAKSEFLANMSHELRTPLNGILGMIDIVMDSELTEAQREELDTARECSLSLLALVNDILDLSKIEAGRMSLERIGFDPRELGENCCKVLAPKAMEKGLELTCEVTPAVPARLLGDPLRLRQVVMNLLSNAVKYTDAGSVRLSLGSGKAPTPGNVELHIDVIDTGIGIPRDKLTSIFDEFMQADGSTTRRYGGTGLGLTIAKKLVGMQGGRIWVESEVGRGSAFHVAFYLPEPSAVPAMAAEAGTEAPGASSGHDGLAQLARILVVEDNLVNQQVVAGLLGKRGYQAVTVNDGREALAALAASDFDLVLMDVQMPVLDGLETTRLIRQDERWRALPVIGVTAHAMAGDRERCIEAGMTDYLPKPVRPFTLLETIRKYLPASKAAAG